MNPIPFTEVMWHVLTEEEKDELKDKNQEQFKERKELKDASKRSTKAFNSKIELCEQEIEDRIKLLDAGKEFRPVDCEWRPNWDSLEVIAYRLDTLEELRRRPMTDDERQRDLYAFEPTEISPSPVDSSTEAERERMQEEAVAAWRAENQPEKAPEGRICVCGELETDHDANAGCLLADCDCPQFKWELEPEEVQSVLALAAVEVPLQTVCDWTSEMRKAALEWAIPAHLQANDNDIEVPSRPAFLDEFIKPTQAEEQSDTFTAPRCLECAMIDGGHTPTCSKSPGAITSEQYLGYAKAHYSRNHNAYARKMELSRGSDDKVRAWLAEQEQEQAKEVGA